VLTHRVFFKQNEIIPILSIFTRTVVLYIIIILLSACGSGDSSTSNSKASENNTSADLTITEAAVLFEAFKSDNRSFHEIVQVDVSQKVKDKITAGKKVFFVITQTDSSFNTLKAEILSTHGNLIIDTPFIDELDHDTYQSTITIRGCYDESCSKEFGKSTIDLKLNKLAIPQLEAVTVTSVDALTIEKQISINLGTTNTNTNNWQVALKYLNKGSDWLNINLSQSGTNALINLSTSTLNCGIYKAKLIFGVTLERGSTISLEVPIYIFNKSTNVSLTKVAPMVQYEGKSVQFTLRGCGFETLDTNKKRISGLDIKNINVRNDFEMEVFGKPLQYHGLLPFSVAGSNTLNLSFKPVPKYETQVTSLSEGASVYYDRSHDIIYNYNWVFWEAAKLIDGKWQVIEDFPKENFGGDSSIAIADDDSVVYALNEKAINIIDANTFKILNQIDLTHLSGRYFTDISALIDGSLLFIKHSNRNYLMKYELKSKHFYNLGEIDGGGNGYDVYTSIDKSIAIINSHELCSCGVSIFTPTYTTLNAILDSNAIAKNRIPINTKHFSISQNGKKRLIGYTYIPYDSFKNEVSFLLYDNNFMPMSELPIKLDLDSGEWFLNYASLTADGKSIYALYNDLGVGQKDSDKIMVEFDVSYLPLNPLKIKRTFEVSDSIYSEDFVAFKLTPDQKTLIFSGYPDVILEKIPN